MFRRIPHVLSLFAFAALLAVLNLPTGCSGKEQPDHPDDALVVKRTSALIDLTWGWLHAENMIVLDARLEDGSYVALLEYEIVIDTSRDDLDQSTLVVFNEYMPMCDPESIQPGYRCPMREAVTFTLTESHGWMPLLAVEFMPEILDDLSAWEEPDPYSFRPAGEEQNG